MGKIFRIFIDDLKTIVRNIIAFIVIIGISILPALYSWFNIASNWDPYSATGGLAFAVCNKDTGFSYQSIEVNAGQQIVDNLKTSDKMGWDFVSEQEAIDGVNSGKYYAAVVIPESFSENLCSITTGKFVQGNLDYYVNEKKNAIAPKITNSGITTITNEVKLAYVGTVTNLLATMLNITAIEVDGNKDQVIGDIKNSLNNITDDIEMFDSTCNVFVSTLNVMKSLIETNKDLLPSISETLTKSGAITKDVKESIESTRNASAKIADSVENIIASADEMQKNIDALVADAFGNIESDSSGAADKLTEISETCKKIMLINDKVLSILNGISESFGIDVSAVTARLTKSNEHQQQLIDMLYSASDTLRRTGTLPDDIRTEIRRAVSAAKADFTGIETAFSSIKTTFNKTVDNVYKVIESASGLLQVVNGDIPEVEKALDSTSTTIDEMITTFENVKKMMDNSKKTISKLLSRIDDIDSNEALVKLVMNIVDDPKALSSFFSEPVVTETHRVYPIENYGSAMSPFYTSLGIWVGGIILIAIIRTELNKKQITKLNRPNNVQMYFGRYLIFFVIGQIQALIISLGDIFFLGIQCNNKFLFIFGSLFSAFVYTLIIYSLTISFNVIGKALSVIILVLQVAGSGGTFPLEVLPEPFRNIAPFLPFKYGCNILREAIAGPDMTSYWNNILMLLLYVPAALLIGLLLRAPCIRLMHFLDKRIHQSELII